MSVSPTAPFPPPIRVEKGEATEEELAAVAVLLLSRGALAGAGAEPAAPGAPSWRPHTFHPPHSWQRS
ncbi:acyl-CoA carboxylase subunit epsilon [Streptomyces sp. CG1]|uniref:acyl-CoA carboxylase subunit epsilon n=1 Tax=Streptomyces sp. CG1 TaxID=1287523 RepID=UPI0034E29E7D